jgi:hypothetical protein
MRKKRRRSKSRLLTDNRFGDMEDENSEWFKKKFPHL